MSEPLLEAKNVSIVFGGLKAVSDFNLQIRAGDLQGLIGPNGAGKTTAFNMLTGVYRPTSGEIHVKGELVSWPAEKWSLAKAWLRLRTFRLLDSGPRPHQINRSGVARTFQNIRLFKDLTAIDNVKVACLSDAHPLFGPESAESSMLFAALNNYYDWWRAMLMTPGFQREEAQITKRAEELLEVMGLSHRRDEEAKNLPYGEQRRLEIARALGTNPAVLLLDEPAAGMNTREKAELMVLIRELRDKFKLGILVIEHDMKLVMGICEKITVLDHGETIAVGSGSEVRQNRKVIEAYLGDSYLEATEKKPQPVEPRA